MTDADWSRVLTLGAAHAVLPLVHRACMGRSDVPQLLQDDLAAWFDEHTRRALRLTGELMRILRRLEAAGITAVPWKGPILAQRAYGDLRLRWSYDLDVIVERQQLATARDLLLAEGFRTEKPMSHAQQEVYVDHQGELELVRDADELWLELHWIVVPTYYAPPRRDLGIRARLTTATLARATVPALAVEDELEALCVHGSKHRWDRLLWVVDIAMLVGTQPVDWHGLLDRARRHGNLRMVHLGLLLARSLAGARLPPEALRSASRDRSAITLQRVAERQLFLDPDARPGPFLFHARMRERARDRARYAVGVLYTPSGADWETVALPRWLFPLYSAARPFRLAWKATRGLRIDPGA
jgi:hypothetical protein